MDQSYYAQGAEVSAPGAPAPVVAVSPETIRLLAATKPWVRFLSVLFFVVIGVCLLGALIFLTLGSVGTGAGPGALGLVPLVTLIILLVAIYLYPAVTLFRYSSAIKLLVETGQVSALEQALARQKSFWKFVGILALVLLCLYIIVGILAVLNLSRM